MDRGQGNMGRANLNVAKNHKGFVRTGRADPLEPGNAVISEELSRTLEPAPAPPNYRDIHSAYAGRAAQTWGLPARAKPQFDDAEAQNLAAREDTSPEVLEILSRESKNPAVLSLVAKHKETTPAILHHMASTLDHEDYEDVVCRIGENQSALPKTMMLIAHSKSEKVKTWAAWHDNTPSDCHVEFRDHINAAVRQGSAENPGAPKDVLFCLGNALYEGDGACRTAAKSNPSYPSVDERLAMARDPSTPRFEQEMLAWDTNATVRKAARERLGEGRPDATELAAEARRRGLPSHVATGIGRRKVALETRTADIADA